jgi:hypothetical protein
VIIFRQPERETAVAEDYPYVLNNGKLGVLLDKISTAAKPERFTYDFLEKLGFTSTNDRGFVSLLRRLGFLTESNQPNSSYDDLRDRGRRPFILAGKIRELYSDLFALDPGIPKAPEADVKGAISRVTGKDEQSVGRMFNTLRALIGQANFDDPPTAAPEKVEQNETEKPSLEMPDEAKAARKDRTQRSEPEFHYNIQIVLPATTEVAVYNAIFKSLRDNLDL